MFVAPSKSDISLSSSGGRFMFAKALSHGGAIGFGLDGDPAAVRVHG
jgi:hypothetical protein